MTRGIVTNCYWATAEPDAELWLKPLADLEVSDLSVSSDTFHEAVLTTALLGMVEYSDRHAAWFDTKTQEVYVPLNHIREEQARFCVYNSMLSEAAVLGFDQFHRSEHMRVMA